jgi:hypothetical protein
MIAGHLSVSTRLVLVLSFGACGCGSDADPTRASGGQHSGGSAAVGGSGGEAGLDSGCITATAKTSSAISTVGIVDWTAAMSPIDSAHAEFGLDTSYGLTAPMDPAELTGPGYRTLLLGMKPNQTYHYRIVAKSGEVECVSPDATLKTGDRLSAVPAPTLEPKTADGLAGGYLVAETYTVSGSGYAFILDADGDQVWAYGPKIGDLMTARMSYDGKYMWIGHGNVPQGKAKVVRVSMDGLEVQDFSADFANLNHDLTVLPDETVGFVAYGDNGCDDVKERLPDGTVRTLFNSGAAFDNSTACHCNAIAYSKDDDSYVVSELDHDAYFKVARSGPSAGQVVWVLGGTVNNSFTGDGANWDNQHNLHVLGLDRLLIFNNGSTGAGSKAIEVQLDLTRFTATIAWEYFADPPISNAILGDVQRLGNGNTMVAYSTQGVMHEVDSSGALLQSTTWPLGGVIGYITKRGSLYGPPPR